MKEKNKIRYSVWYKIGILKGYGEIRVIYEWINRKLFLLFFDIGKGWKLERIEMDIFVNCIFWKNRELVR